MGWWGVAECAGRVGGGGSSASGAEASSPADAKCAALPWAAWPAAAGDTDLPSPLGRKDSRGGGEADGPSLRRSVPGGSSCNGDSGRGALGSGAIGRFTKRTDPPFSARTYIAGLPGVGAGGMTSKLQGAPFGAR